MSLVAKVLLSDLVLIISTLAWIMILRFSQEDDDPDAVPNYLYALFSLAIFILPMLMLIWIWQ